MNTNTPNTNMGLRLHEERMRLLYSAEHMAEQCGLTLKQYMKYEMNQAMPSEKVIQDLHYLGVDIGFVMLNQKHRERVWTDDITLEEDKLIKLYRRLTPTKREEFVLQLFYFDSESQGKTA